MKLSYTMCFLLNELKNNDNSFSFWQRKDHSQIYEYSTQGRNLRRTDLANPLPGNAIAFWAVMQLVV